MSALMAEGKPQPYHPAMEAWQLATGSYKGAIHSRAFQETRPQGLGVETEPPATPAFLTCALWNRAPCSCGSLVVTLPQNAWAALAGLSIVCLLMQLSRRQCAQAAGLLSWHTACG